MGTVMLTHSHHGLYIHNSEPELERRIELTPELLFRPFLDGRGEVMISPTRYLAQGALQALLKLPGFDAAVSFGITEKEGIPHITMPHRVWGEITLGAPDSVVVGFSHDSRYVNHPFQSLVQWLEDKYHIYQRTDETYERFCMLWSRPELWTEFFQARIRKEIGTLRAQATKLEQQARDLTQRSAAIEAALG